MFPKYLSLWKTETVSFNKYEFNAYMPGTEQRWKKIPHALGKGMKDSNRQALSALRIIQYAPEKPVDNVWAPPGGDLSLHHFSSGKGT